MWTFDDSIKVGQSNDNGRMNTFRRERLSDYSSRTSFESERFSSYHDSINGNRFRDSHDQVEVYEHNFNSGNNYSMRADNYDGLSPYSHRNMLHSLPPNERHQRLSGRSDPFKNIDLNHSHRMDINAGYSYDSTFRANNNSSMISFSSNYISRPSSSFANPSLSQFGRKQIDTQQRHNIKAGTVFFGSCYDSSSLIGSCSWWVSDARGKIISSGAIPVHQTYLNPSHLEFKALFHALNAAHVCGINQLVVKGTSVLALSYISKDKPFQKIPYLDTVYESMSDLEIPIKRSIKKLHDYRTELIPIESNGFCDRLASRSIQKCQRRLLSERSDQSKIHLMNASLTNYNDDDDDDDNDMIEYDDISTSEGGSSSMKSSLY